MKMIFTTSLLPVLFCSCFSTHLNYIGSSYAPTKVVEVYVHTSAIKRPYTVIGKGYFDEHVYQVMRGEQLQEIAVEKAKLKGADAVLFMDILLVNNSTSISSRSQTDSIGQSLVTMHDATISPVISNKRDILFLKYDR
jgi:hypothetical protein